MVRINHQKSDRKKAFANLVSRMKVREARQDLYTDPARTLVETEKALETDPENPMLLGTKAQCLMNMGKGAEALVSARKVLELTHSVISSVIFAKIQYNLGNFAGAEDTMRTALQIRSRSDKAACFKLLAEALRKQKKYDQAIAVLADAPVEYCGNELCRAYCLMEMENLADSFQAFLSAEHLLSKPDDDSPADQRVRLYVGYVFLAKRYIDQALAIPSDLLDKVKQASDWLGKTNENSLGMFQRHDFRNAMRVLSEIPGFRKAHPNWQAQIQRAGQLSSKDPQAALNIISKVETQLDEDNLYVTGIKANCLLALGQLEEAETYAQKNLELNIRESKPAKRIVGSYIRLVRIQLRLDQYDQAYSLITKALALEQNAAVYALLAIVQMKREQYTRAEFAIRRAMELNDHFNNLRILSQIHFGQKRYPKTLSVLNQLTHRQHNIFSLMCKAKCHLRLKQFMAALNALQGAEQELREKSNLKIEICIGYVFAFAGCKAKGKQLNDKLKQKISDAAVYLMSLDGTKIPDEYQQDYKKAIELIKKLNGH